MDIPARLPCNPAVIQDWNDVRYAIVVARCGSLAGAARQVQASATHIGRGHPGLFGEILQGLGGEVFQARGAAHPHRP